VKNGIFQETQKKTAYQGKKSMQKKISGAKGRVGRDILNAYIRMNVATFYDGTTRTRAFLNCIVDSFPD